VGHASARQLVEKPFGPRSESAHSKRLIRPTPQVDALSALDAFTAAALLARVPADHRRELLSLLDPAVAANIVQAGGAGYWDVWERRRAPPGLQEAERPDRLPRRTQSCAAWA
jgi:hypothetical protein